VDRADDVLTAAGPEFSLPIVLATHAPPDCETTVLADRGVANAALRALYPRRGGPPGELAPAVHGKGTLNYTTFLSRSQRPARPSPKHRSTAYTPVRR
jgi:hypothetical protein